MQTYSERYLEGIRKVVAGLNPEAIETIAETLAGLRELGGCLFIAGNGGSAANASHAAADFRKLCGIQACSMDNMAELTASANDSGWELAVRDWLVFNHAISMDALLVLSVGGGGAEVSVNITRALAYAAEIGMIILGIVGRDGGETARVADACLVVPTLDPSLVTPHTESAQSIVLHLLCTHPRLQLTQAKWESVQ